MNESEVYQQKQTVFLEVFLHLILFLLVERNRAGGGGREGRERGKEGGRRERGLVRGIEGNERGK